MIGRSARARDIEWTLKRTKLEQDDSRGIATRQYRDFFLIVTNRRCTNSEYTNHHAMERDKEDHPCACWPGPILGSVKPLVVPFGNDCVSWGQ